MAGNGVLVGKTAFVTGGAGGIGAACAHHLVKDGAAVLLMGRRKAALEGTRKELRENTPGARIELFPGDATNADEVQAALKAAHAIQGRLDIVVPTVGGGGFRPLLMHTAETFRAEFDLNVVSAFMAVRYGAPLMANGGSIILISSTSGTTVFPSLIAYTTAKAALESFLRGAADELGAAGIRVNAVRPGLTRNSGDNGLLNTPAVFDNFVRETPLKLRAPGQLGEADDIGFAVRFLAGPESSWITGQSFAIDGGQELRKNADLTWMIESVFGTDALAAFRKGQAPKG